MKKQLTKKLMAVVVAVICCATSVISACAVSSNDISSYTDCLNDVGRERVFYCSTSLPYICTWVRVTSSAQKYPSGSALLSGLSTTKNNNSFAGHHRIATGYTDKMTVYGAHSMYKDGKSYIRYSTTPNV